MISEAKIFTGVIREAIEHCTPSTDVSQYFLDFKHRLRENCHHIPGKEGLCPSSDNNVQTFLQL